MGHKPDSKAVLLAPRVVIAEPVPRRIRKPRLHRHRFGRVLVLPVLRPWHNAHNISFRDNRRWKNWPARDIAAVMSSDKIKHITRGWTWDEWKMDWQTRILMSNKCQPHRRSHNNPIEPCGSSSQWSLRGNILHKHFYTLLQIIESLECQNGKWFRRNEGVKVQDGSEMLTHLWFKIFIAASARPVKTKAVTSMKYQ